MSRVATIIGLFCIVMMAVEARAQTYFTTTEIGVSLGCSQYFGDLNDNYGFKTINAGGGLYLRKHMNHYISVKWVTNYTKVGYSDSYNSEPFEHERNLSFESIIIETALQAEFNFFAFVTGDKQHRFTPFLTGGIGAFYYNPYTYYNGSKVYLQPLGTEGQNAGYGGRKYSNYSACFPVGVGAKWWLKGGVNLTIEIADRLTLTDYLDDVSSTYVGSGSFSKNPTAAALQNRSLSANSEFGTAGKQRGNTASYDQYAMALLSISWHFKSYRCPRFMSEDLIKVTK